MPQIVVRATDLRARLMIEQSGVHPLLARLFANRGMRDGTGVQLELKSLLPPATLTHADSAAQLLASAIAARQKLLVIADYDCDGATACAVALRGLRLLFPEVHIDYLVPDRFKYGYGLTPGIVELAAQHPRLGRPDLIITVDNGIARVEGVARAAELGIQVLVTDHHLPGDALPNAACIVNPNQAGCKFASKSLAGVGVMFYVLLALRAHLRVQGHYAEAPEPNLGALLDLVALGTVADVVALDHNNRILVAQGLKRIRQGRAHAGIAALLRVAGRDARQATTFDFGFALGPRLNAAGRLDDMSVGIECLLTDDMNRALALAQQLDTLNRERREIEGSMQETALAKLDARTVPVEGRYTISLYDVEWHQGVVGIVASRLKDRYHRPAIVFAPDDNADLLKGSGRSIKPLHLRDCLDLVSKRHPALIEKFGGHAMAAGLTIRATNFDAFAAAFEAAAAQLLRPADLAQTLETDGPLELAYLNLPAVQMLQAEVWGQGFPPPIFSDEFTVKSQRLIKEKHLKLVLEKNGQQLEAIQFNTPDAAQSAPAKIRAAYELAVDEFNGVTKVSVIVRHWEPMANN